MLLLLHSVYLDLSVTIIWLLSQRIISTLHISIWSCLALTLFLLAAEVVEDGAALPYIVIIIYIKLIVLHFYFRFKK